MFFHITDAGACAGQCAAVLCSSFLILNLFSLQSVQWYLVARKLEERKNYYVLKSN